MNDERNVITQGAVAIDTGEIVSVGSIKDIERNFQSRQLVDGTDQIVMPGTNKWAYARSHVLAAGFRRRYTSHGMVAGLH